MTDGEMQQYRLTLDKFLRHAAKWHPEAEVVTAHADGAVARVGYAELMARSQRVSAVLQRLGIRKGDRVATLAWNTQAHVETWYAIMGMGAVCHTLNPRLTAAQLGEMAARSEAKLIVASADLAPLAQDIRARAPRLERLLLIDAPADDPAALEPMLAADGEVAWGAFEETLPCGLCFTSGTTGAPKGVTYTHRASYLHTLRSLQADMMAFKGSDTVLARLINQEGVTIAVGVPTVWLGLVEQLDAVGGEVPTLERIVVGGAPMPPALMARIERRLGVTVQTSWGMTELSPSGTVAPPHDANRAAHFSGRPAVGLDLLLTDASGAPLEDQRGGEGHLQVRGQAVVERYFGEAEPATDAEGWFSTGDLARIDGHGNLIITGRAKDLIKSGGEWINPAEIEAVIGALPQVALAAVIGRPDPKWGERPILLVETRGEEPVSDETLLEPLRGRVAPWWIPDEVFRLANMPLAPTGKIDKMRLRSEYGNG